MNLFEAAAHAREVETIETVRVAVLAAKKVTYEEKGGAGSGSQEGHHFGGNRYTGGISEGGTGYVAHPRLSKATLPLTNPVKFRRAVAVSAAHFDGIANQQIGAEEARVHITGRAAFYLTAVEKVKDQVVFRLSQESGLSGERSHEMIKTWARSASDTEPDSVALQMAASAKFGTDPGAYLRERSDFMSGGYAKTVEVGPPAPRTDVDPVGRLLMGQDDIEGTTNPEYNEKWNDQMKGFHDAVAMSMQLDKETSFVVPKEYMTSEERMSGTRNPDKVITVDEYSHEIMHPFPGFGSSVYTKNDYWSQTRLENGDVRFTRDNTLATVGRGDLEAAQSSGRLPISWDDRYADAQKVVDATYERTQKILAENLVKDMTLFRGMNWNGPPNSADIPEQLRQVYNPGSMIEAIGTKEGANEVTIALNPLSSFSVNSNSANSFGSGSRGVTLGVRVPADRIFSLASTGPGCLNEGEVLVIGGPTDMVGGRGYPTDSGGDLTDSETSLGQFLDKRGLPQSEYYG